MSKVYVSTIVYTSTDALADVKTSIFTNYEDAKEFLLSRRGVWIDGEVQNLLDNEVFESLDDAIDHFILNNEMNNYETIDSLYYSHFADEDGCEAIFKLECLTYQE